MNQLALSMAPADLAALRRAHRHLEHPSLAIRLGNIVGTPIEGALRLLPKTWHEPLHRATEAVVAKLFDSAVATLPNRPPRAVSNALHRALVMSSGAVGGFFGLPALLVELPISTNIMLRSIADIAQQSGEDLANPAVRLACIEVFALGARSQEDDAAETGYYGVRLALAWNMQGSIEHIAQHGLTRTAGPYLVNAISAISHRFGIAISEKAAAQALPVLGAACGAVVNCVFMLHFQDMAWSHFTVRRLERTYGPETVQAAYDELTRSEDADSCAKTAARTSAHAAVPP